MARFYPQLNLDQIDFHGSFAEERVYAKLQELPDRVRVFHSFSWASKQHHRYKKHGEADFIIYDPQFGILVMEVKGGGISHEEGIWWQKDATGARRLSSDPWIQAEDSKYFLIGLLQDCAKDAFVPIHTCLWFPDTHIGSTHAKNLPHHVRPFALLGREEFTRDGSLESILEKIWEGYKLEFPAGISIPQGFNERLVEILLPTVNLVPATNLGAEELDRIFYRLTKEQIKILEFIEDQKKVAIGGGAGSGKTMIAKEQALRLARESLANETNQDNQECQDKTLLIVYNSALQEDLEKSLKHENLDVLTWGKLAYAHAERNAPDVMSGELVNKILNDDYILPYKNIVIDEGQDFEADWITALDWTAELNDGGMYLFYDNRQKIQGEEDGIGDWIAKAESKLTINRNCRNTNAIAKTSHAFLGEKPPKMLDDIEGPMPIWIELQQNDKDFFKTIEILTKKLQERTSPEEISLVTLGNLKYSLLKGLDYVEPLIDNKKMKVPVKEKRQKGNVLKTTVRKFKGLESQVVIVTDLKWTSEEKWLQKVQELVEEKAIPYFTQKHEEMCKELYTSISRAKREIILITKPLPERLVWNNQVHEAEEFRKFFCETYCWERGV